MRVTWWSTCLSLMVVLLAWGLIARACQTDEGLQRKLSPSSTVEAATTTTYYFQNGELRIPCKAEEFNPNVLVTFQDKRGNIGGFLAVVCLAGIWEVNYER